MITCYMCLHVYTGSFILIQCDYPPKKTTAKHTFCNNGRRIKKSAKTDNSENKRKFAPGLLTIDKKIFIDDVDALAYFADCSFISII